MLLSEMESSRPQPWPRRSLKSVDWVLGLESQVLGLEVLSLGLAMSQVVVGFVLERANYPGNNFRKQWNSTVIIIWLATIKQPPTLPSLHIYCVW